MLFLSWGPPRNGTHAITRLWPPYSPSPFISTESSSPSFLAPPPTQRASTNYYATLASAKKACYGPYCGAGTPLGSFHLPLSAISRSSMVAQKPSQCVTVDEPAILSVHRSPCMNSASLPSIVCAPYMGTPALWQLGPPMLFDFAHSAMVMVPSSLRKDCLLSPHPSRHATAEGGELPWYQDSLPFMIAAISAAAACHEPEGPSVVTHTVGAKPGLFSTSTVAWTVSLRNCA